MRRGNEMQPNLSGFIVQGEVLFELGLGHRMFSCHPVGNSIRHEITHDNLPWSAQELWAVEVKMGLHFADGDCAGCVSFVGEPA
jgi:hypothetical protein